MLSLLFKTICIFAVVEVIYDADKPLVYYEKILIHIFVVQTFIQLLGYFYRPFSDIIVLFNHAYKLHSGYDGIRGLGLSGGTGSGLGWAYGLAIILYTKVYLIETKKITISSVAVGLFLFLGIFFSARTGFLGCILSAIYFVFSPLGTLDKIKKTGVFIFILALIIGIVYLVFYNWISIIIEKVLPYVFEFFYNKAKTGRLETVSTDTLFEMWKTSQFIDEKNFLLGDGWFTDPITGRYYHQTDVGYLRNMFYWGFIGTLINYIGQIYVFKGILLSRNNSGDKRFVFYLLLFEFIVELKANTVSFSHITMIFFIYYILIYTKHFSNGLRTCQRL
jgi:hypothetical protein